VRVGCPVGGAEARAHCRPQATPPPIASLPDQPAELENHPLFDSHGGCLFNKDAFYADGYVPTARQLVGRIRDGT